MIYKFIHVIKISIFLLYIRYKYKFRTNILLIQAKSPVFSHVNASLNGLTTIRSCGKKIEDRLIMEFDRYQDEHSSTWHLTIVTAAAFGMILDFILILLNAVIAYSFIFLNNGKYTTE
jgi:ATP-binding cassette subfamily C (CFTR/MRP) protein 4